MKGKIVAILETRTGQHLGELIGRRGGIPLLAPALEEVPDIDPQDIVDLVQRWQREPYGAVIFQTGVGTRALFATADSLGLTGQLLGLLTRSVVVVRGPKPTGELTARGVIIHCRAASPFTSETVLEALAAVPLMRARVLVQRYGATNAPLRDALARRGAAVDEVATYRWALPADTAPLRHLLDELAAARIDAVVFTSAVQVQHLYRVAESLERGGELGARLRQVFIASIGPVCSRALRERGVEPSFEADPPKLGSLVAGLQAALT